MKQKKQKITAFFLLGVFLLALLNSVVPHTHHSHTADVSFAFSSANTHEHSHNNEHHHHNKTQQQELSESNENSYIHIGEHSHQNHLHDFPSFRLNKTQKIQKNTFSMLFLGEVFSFNKTLTSKQKNKTIYKEKPYKAPCSLSTPLRGPPFLA